jgi:hypothetical protein
MVFLLKMLKFLVFKFNNHHFSKLTLDYYFIKAYFVILHDVCFSRLQ